MNATKSSGKFQIRIDPDVHERLRELSYKTRASINSLVKLAIDKLLAERADP